MLKVYSYNWATGEYLGEEVADPSPLEPGTYLMPAYSTTFAPPEVEEGKRAIFDLQKEEWYVEDIPVEIEGPRTFNERLAAIPSKNLVGDLTIGDLFYGQR